jgi:serine-type D-Ala-D-Ala carboxypeptidase/endopeptidase (penicillin-binding protein 4)
MKQVILASFLLIFSFPCFSQFETLIKSYVADAQAGLWVQDADTQEVLYTYNADHRFTPASVTKSYTVAATLLDLPPNFTYQTKLLYDKSKLNNGVLEGDIALQFSGDPSLTTQDLENLLQQLNIKGIKTIKGNVFIDNTAFSKPDAGLGWVITDLSWYFASPAKSVIIDENRVPITLTPAANLGQKTVIQPLADKIINLSSDVITVSETDAKNLCQLNVELEEKNNGVHLYGCWPLQAQQSATTLRVALPNAELRANDIIQQSLASLGINLTGKIQIASSNTLPDTLATHQSLSLSVILAKIMRESNNIYADSLAKTLGKKNYQRGTLQAGSYAITQILKDRLKLDSNSFRLSDGSGVSIYNQITPKNVAMLLQGMYNETSYRDDFLTSMQVLDSAHSFYKRTPKNLTTPIYIKTGGLTGVSNVTGYVKTQSGKTLIVVSLLNQLPADRTKASEFEQRIIETLAKL